MTGRLRTAVAVTVFALLASAATTYVVWKRGENDQERRRLVALTGTVSFDAPASLIVRDLRPGPTRDHLAQLRLDDPATRVVSDNACARTYAARGHGICLRPSHDAPGAFEVAFLDASAKPVDAFPLVGVPSRARVSASGRMFSWTVFVTGDSYNHGRFSTRSGIYDLETDDLVSTLEDWEIVVAGQQYDAPDLNFWGITFTDDDNRFYATMSTKGTRYLVEGDYAARTVTAIRDNVECPSLSPDGSRLVFKRRAADQTWRFVVLDLDTMTETPLAEERSVDDQAAWVDDQTVMYAVPRAARRADVWSVPADGSGRPTLLIADADSPAALP